MMLGFVNFFMMFTSCINLSMSFILDLESVLTATGRLPWYPAMFYTKEEGARQGSNAKCLEWNKYVRQLQFTVSVSDQLCSFLAFYS